MPAVDLDEDLGRGPGELPGEPPHPDGVRPDLQCHVLGEPAQQAPRASSSQSG